MESNSEIDHIISELKSTAIVNTNHAQAVSQNVEVTDDTVNHYVYEKTTEVIQAGLEAINNIKNTISMGADPKEISALAQLINATTKAIDSMNSINLQQRHAKSAVELKKLDIAGKKEIISKLPPTSNNILIATREEVAKMIDRPKKCDQSIIDSD